MLFLILVFLTVAIGLIGFISCAAYLDGQCNKWVPIIFMTLLVVTIVWWFGALNQPTKVELEETLPIKVIESPNGPMQVVVYCDPNGDTQFLNFHKQFGCQATEGTMVRHTRFACGPYCGLYFARQHSLSDKWEIVK